ncbi:fimbrial protein [Phytobacter diazotrophicus]|uniref:fimbrial protein n=1 Tax=Phytobacter diazotrophicus TaxID=395631 RepID=UPI0013EC91DA|nr:fimbrial protein [Phytobacter diazotrophicus]MDU7130834.1 fimbrial protein [Enterobacteriaceae bacterium]QIH64102.1 hypothetical protein CRX67_13975 [Enterobacteriaceae bacterium A-F18]
MIRERLLSIIVILSALLFSFSAQAWCTLVSYSPGDQPAGKVITSNIKLSSTLRMPKDIAVGTELYRVHARNDTYIFYRANCNNNSTYTNYYVMGRFVGGITPALSSWQGSSLGTVYQTGIAGIGMVVLNNGRAMGDKKYSFGTCYTKSDYSCNTYTSNGNLRFILIKTGEITDSFIDLSTLPKVEAVVGGHNSPGSDVPVFRPSLTGRLTFTQATCTLAEASKTVDLGKYKASEFTAANTATPWVKASIDLLNCNYGGAQSYGHFIENNSSSGSKTIRGPITANAIWSLSLTPATSVIDDANGIMAISSDSNSATGIGIQLSSSNTTLQPMTFSQPTTGTLVSGTDATMTIPLYARYIKTGAAVTPGRADGKLTYLIEYK